MAIKLADRPMMVWGRPLSPPPPTDPRMLKLFTHIYLQPISVTSIMASVDGPSLTLTKCNGRDTVVLPGVAAPDHQVTTLGQKQVGQSGNYMCGSPEKLQKYMVP